MRGLSLAGLSAAAAIMIAGPSEAAGLLSCLNGCGIQGNGRDFDYTVPSDGRFYRWDFYASNPDITVTLTAPNDVFAITKSSNGDGTFQEDFETSFKYVFQENATAGHTSVVVWAPADFSNCSASSSSGSVCAASYNVWGDGTYISLSGPTPSFRDPPTTVRLTVTAIPEPASWCLMIVGFAGLGASLRLMRKRASRAAASA